MAFGKKKFLYYVVYKLDIYWNICNSIPIKLEFIGNYFTTNVLVPEILNLHLTNDGPISGLSNCGNPKLAFPTAWDATFAQ